MAFPLFVQEIDKHGAARITLTRGEVHNAFNEALIAELTAALVGAAEDPRVRVVVLAGRGKAFCGGADVTELASLDAANGGAFVGRIHEVAGAPRVGNDDHAVTRA